MFIAVTGMTSGKSLCGLQVHLALLHDLQGMSGGEQLQQASS